MDKFQKEVAVRWADLDPNGHMRHSVYYDLGAYCRIEFLTEHRLSPSRMMELHVGPVIFREECVFKRELLLTDKVTVEAAMLNSRRDFSRWAVQHLIYKNHETLAAVLTLDGAWIDTVKRKLTIPPAEVATAFGAMPLAEDFSWTD